MIPVTFHNFPTPWVYSDSMCFALAILCYNQMSGYSIYELINWYTDALGVTFNVANPTPTPVWDA